MGMEKSGQMLAVMVRLMRMVELMISQTRFQTRKLFFEHRSHSSLRVHATKLTSGVAVFGRPTT